MIRLALLASFAAIFLAAPAVADGPICGSSGAVLEAMATDMGMSPSAIGTSGERGVLMMQAEDGKWAIFVQPVQGVLCLVMSGRNWRSSSVPPAATQQPPDPPPRPIARGDPA